VLLGVVILAAMVLIGAATIGVIYVRQLNQQRQIQTQVFIERAFHGLFPGNGRRNGASMYNDFGYSPNPAGTPYDLWCMVNRSDVGTSDLTNAGVLQFAPGALVVPKPKFWNGPYWTGPVNAFNRPVDAWGRPLQLRFKNIPPTGWQVFSWGLDGSPNTVDDLAYPNPPYAIPGICPTMNLDLQRNSGLVSAENVTITLSWTANNGGNIIRTVLFPPGLQVGNPLPAFPNVPEDFITISISSDIRGPLTPLPSNSFILTNTCNPTITF
jgi:hypothetical protein